MNNSKLTAISRNKISTPTKYLLNNELLKGDILDYGCGKGFDADKLGFDKYDPHYFPLTLNKVYGIIVCNYVLNVIPYEKDRLFVIIKMKNLLKKEGVIYLSVRNDKKNLNGWTKKGTWQGEINLKYPIVKKTSNFKMYIIRKRDKA